MHALYRRLNGRYVDFLHRHHRLEGASARFATRSQGLGQCPWRDLPRDAPFVFAPPALAFLAAVAHNGVPVAVCLFLTVGRDLERERLAVLECGTAIETDASNASHGEVDGQYITRLAARIVGRRAMHRNHATVGKGCGVEASCSLGLPVKP